MFTPEDLEDATGMEYRVRDERQLDPGPVPVVRVVSTKPIPVRASVEPPHVAHHLGRSTGHWFNVFDALSGVVGPIIPELHFDLFNTVGKPLVAAVDKVITASFEPTLPKDYVRPVMHVPTITAAHAAMSAPSGPAHGLVIAASPAEAERFEAVRKKHFESRNVRVKYLLVSDETGYHIPVNMMCEYTRDYVSWMMDPKRVDKYDFIFMAHSMGKVFEQGARSRNEVYTMLRSMVRQGGSLWGLFYDVDAMKQLSTHGDFIGSTELVVTYEEPSLGTEGACHSQVGSKSFLDFRFSEAGLSAILPPTDESKLWSARHFCSHVHDPPPEFKKTAIDPRLEPIRVWHVTVNHAPLHAIGDRVYVPWVEALQDTGRLADEVEGFNRFFANRGRPFNDVDLFYLSPDRIRITPKADGVETKIWFDGSGRGHVVMRGDPRVYSIPWPGPPHSKWHVELLAVGRRGRGDGAVVADIIAGAHQDHGYYTRMLWAADMVKVYKLPFIVPVSTKLTMACEFPPPPDYPYDGYVVNWDYSLPRINRDGFGPARYLKDRYTFESFDDDGQLVERYIDDGSYRLRADLSRTIRHDKDEPTSTRECDELRQAWTTSQFRARVSSLSLPPPTLLDKLMRGPVDGIDPFALSDTEIAYLYCPFRSMDIEAQLYHVYGAHGVQALHLSKAIGMARVIRDRGLQHKPVDYSRYADNPYPVAAESALASLSEYAAAMAQFIVGEPDTEGEKEPSPSTRLA